MRAGLGVFVFCVIVSLQPVLTAAQAPPFELGMDASLDMSAGKGTESVLSIPNRSVRIGVFVSDLVSIENRISFGRIKIDSYETSTVLSLQISGVIHFTPDRNQPQAYANPTLGLRSSSSGDVSGSQLEFGCGLGVKIPIAAYLSGRFEAGYWYGSENEVFEEFKTVTVRLGFSLFTK